MDNLLKQTKFKTVMMYFIDYYTLQLAEQRGLKIIAIVDLTNGDNTNVINNAINMAKQFSNTIVSLSCGNELGMHYGRNDNTARILNQCVTALRRGNVPQPVGVIDTFDTWCDKRESTCDNPWTTVTNGLDWIGVNAYPWWSNIFSGGYSCNSHEQAAEVTLDMFRKVINAHPIPVVLTEFGWPGAPAGSTIQPQANVINGRQCGLANDANQKIMVQKMVDLCRSHKLPCNTFQSFREVWKAQEYNFDAHWGVCSGTPPYNCYNAPV